MMSLFANLIVQVAGTHADFVIKSQQELVHKFLLWANSEGSAMEAIAIDSLRSTCLHMSYCLYTHHSKHV